MTDNSIKFIVDVGVGKSIENYLRDKGYDSKAVREIDPAMSDDDIIRLAATEKRMVVTMDKDFGELVYHSCMDHYGVLLLRLEDATVPEKLQIIKFLLNSYSSKMANCFCVFQKNKFRIKQINKNSGRNRAKP